MLRWSSGFCTKRYPALMTEWCNAVNRKSVRGWLMTLILLGLWSSSSLSSSLSSYLLPSAALHQFWPLRGSQASLVTSQAGGEQLASGLWILFIPFLSVSLGFGFWCFFANIFQTKMPHVSKFSSRVYQHTDGPGRPTRWSASGSLVVKYSSGYSMDCTNHLPIIYYYSLLITLWWRHCLHWLQRPSTDWLLKCLTEGCSFGVFLHHHSRRRMKQQTGTHAENSPSAAAAESGCCLWSWCHLLMCSCVSLCPVAWPAVSSKALGRSWEFRPQQVCRPG